MSVDVFPPEGTLQLPVWNVTNKQQNKLSWVEYKWVKYRGPLVKLKQEYLSIGLKTLYYLKKFKFKAFTHVNWPVS